MLIISIIAWIVLAHRMQDEAPVRCRWTLVHAGSQALRVTHTNVNIIHKTELKRRWSNLMMNLKAINRKRPKGQPLYRYTLFARKFALCTDKDLPQLDARAALRANAWKPQSCSHLKICWGRLRSDSSTLLASALGLRMNKRIRKSSSPVMKTWQKNERITYWPPPPLLWRLEKISRHFPYRLTIVANIESEFSDTVGIYQVRKSLEGRLCQYPIQHRMP